MTEFSIYQINTDRDNNRVCFLGLDSLERFQHSKEVDPALYDRVYDGKLDCNSLETIYEKFNIDHPADYKGRSLSVSDVVEIRESDTLNPGFYFVDSIGFKSISFDKSLCKEPVKASDGKISVLLVEPNKYPKMIEIDDTLEAMQAVVGGDIEEYILTANKKRTTSSWEQRKVQDVADRFDNLRIPVAANLRVHGTTPYYGANGIQDYVEGFTHDGEFVLVAEDGANDLKNYPVKCVNGRIWVNNHAHILQGKAGIADNSFLAFAISQSDIESLLVGGGRAKLNAETLMSIEFRLPCLQEQYRIGEYLTQLDHLITLHQRKPFLMKWRTSDANRNQTNRLVL